jgi:hypothetical protein
MKGRIQRLCLFYFSQKFLLTFTATPYLFETFKKS